MALHISEHILAYDCDIQVDEIVGHGYLFLKEQLQLSIIPPHSGILHGTMIGECAISHTIYFYCYIYIPN